MTGLITLLTNCATNKVPSEEITFDVFPDFPEPEYIINNEDGTCTVPSQYILDLSNFKIDYEYARKYYEKETEN